VSEKCDDELITNKQREEQAILYPDQMETFLPAHFQGSGRALVVAQPQRRTEQEDGRRWRPAGNHEGQRISGEDSRGLWRAVEDR